MEENKDFKDKLKKQVEEKLTEISEQGIQPDNLEMLYELTVIHKDIEHENYWDKKKEVMDMRYSDDRSYGTYNTGYGARRRDSRGRYMARGGRRYRGEDMLEEMKEHYGNYMEGSQYGGIESEEALDYMLQSAEDFFMHLMEESDSPEQMEKIKRTAKKISEMRM